MPTIKKNIEDVIKEVKDDLTGVKGERLRKLAVDAIYAGQGTPAWKAYMKTYADPPNYDNPVQLARLTGVNDPGCTATPYLKEARAYLIANATCGTPTFTTTTFGIDDVLDKTLPPAPPPAPARKNNRRRKR